MPEHSIKLYYFPMRGRAETARLILAYAGIKYDNVLISAEQWPSMKDKMPMGQLPVLEVDGKQLCQSASIARYLAREYGLAGKNNWDTARADMLSDGMFDMWVHLNPVYMPKLEGNIKLMEENWSKFVQEHLKKFLDRYTRFLNENKTGYFVGDSLTWADIAVAEFISALTECFNPTAADGHPELKEFSRKILSLPQLKSYAESRPPTPL